MKVCFIGLGSIGTRHCCNLTKICMEEKIPLEIHAVRSSNGKLRSELDDKNLHFLYSFEEMDSDYDAVFITNPTSKHYETLRKTADRSRCFFIEKPVFEHWNEDVSELQFRKDAVCYVAAPLRYTGVLQQAQNFVKTNNIYSARAISSSYLPDWRPGVDYRNTYSAHKELGGGVSIDLIHEWDYLTALFGFPEKIFSISGKYSHLEIDSDDLAVYIGAYQNLAVEVHLDYFGRKTVRQLELFTEDGTHIFDIANAKIIHPNGLIENFQEEPNDKYLKEMRYFLSLTDDRDAISTNTIKHAADVLRLAEGIDL